MVLGRLLTVFWTAKRSNQSILKEISPEYSLEETLMLERREEKGVRWLDGIINSMDMSLSKLQEIVEERGTWHAAVHKVVKSQTQLSD